MGPNIKTIAASALAFSTLGNCHMIMKTPVPYGVSTLNNSPLVDATPGTAESDFPCKQRPGVYDITKMNNIEVGTPQELSFIGSASHGGGTCQLAVTKDKEPTANSTFKLFQVFEGGCPVSSSGNTGSHPFTFELPKEMPNGVMTLAWLWYNRIGNRELYMNCAPITVTGGSSSDTYFDSLPNAYVVNMPTSECQTSFEGIQNAVTIPHPGQYIMKDTAGQEIHAATGPGCAAAAAKQLDGVVGYKSNVVQNGASYKFAGAPADPSGNAVSGAPSAQPSQPGGYGGGYGGPSAAPSGGASAAPSAPAASGSAPAASGSAPAASGSAPAPSGSAPAPSGGAPAFGSAPAASGSAPAASGSAVAAPSASAPAASGSAPAPSGFAAAPSASAPAASGSAPAASGSVAAPAPSGSAPSAPAASGAACSATSSAMSCSSDGKQFGVCADGKMVWRAVAPGTTCSNGEITKRDEVVNRHARRHIRLAGRRAI